MSLHPSHSPHAANERGATAVEYALLVTFIAIAIIVGVTAFASTVGGLFESFVGIF